MKNVITIDRSVVVLSPPPPPPLSILFLKTPCLNVCTKNTRNELARLVMGIIFLVIQIYGHKYQSLYPAYAARVVCTCGVITDRQVN